MNDDYSEILAAIRRLEVEFTKTAQSFADYKEARKDLPEKIRELQEKTAKCGQACEYQKSESRGYFKKVDFLMTWYGRGAALIFAFQILIAGMVLLGRIIDIEYTLKP